MAKNNDTIPSPEIINHGVRRLAYGFLFSIIAGVILTIPFVEKLKDIIGTENYGKLTVFISLFLPLLVNWFYNKTVREKLRQDEEIVESKIASEFTTDDIESLPPSDRELVKKSMDKKSHYLKVLKAIKRNQEDI